jgi:hypothetical protein
MRIILPAGSKGAQVLSVQDNSTDCGSVAVLKRGTFLQLNVTFIAGKTYGWSSNDRIQLDPNS